jgi:hypothetical protein
VNYRYRYRVTPDEVETLIDDLYAGRLADEIPPHGTLARVRQQPSSDRFVGAVSPDVEVTQPSWLDGKAAL